jgi:hypothetical protein
VSSLFWVVGNSRATYRAFFIIVRLLEQKDGDMERKLTVGSVCFVLDKAKTFVMEY